MGYWKEFDYWHGRDEGFSKPRPVASNKGNAMKSDFGYPSTEPCRVCGQRKNNQSEPRFGYTVCEDHQNVAPTDIPPKPPEPGA